MIFSELYSAYYHAVAQILKTALDHPLERNELRRIVERHAFGESLLKIEPSLTGGEWQMLLPDGTTPIQNVPSMPLTAIQKQWLKAISLDPRIRLFQDELIDLPDVEPLFTQEDYCVFDKYADGDNFEDETYRKNFRLILDALRGRYPLSIDMNNHRGKAVHMVLLPERLEYSEKDDKFRLIGSDQRLGGTVNLGRITGCMPYTGEYDTAVRRRAKRRPRSVIFELTDQRKALERVLMHFAHYEKQAERLEGDRYKVTIHYDKDDETELVIRVLSFGPMIKVIAPDHFINLIRERLIRQRSCEH